jgi:uncharacterized protein (TIGR03382 family)
VKHLALVLLVACAEPTSESTIEADLTAAVKQERLQLIRDSAAEMGVTNAALMGGIAVSETGLAHCQSEATYACKGPASPSCGGGPIIAGSADGPCSDQQGGLGMFQFDSGTYAQTLATYGDSILTVEGNTAQAVSFVVDRLIQSVDGVTDWTSAVAYMNSVPMKAGEPQMEEWSHFLACRYNGCCSTSSLCTSRANGYRDNALDLYTEMGMAFWNTADRCAALPADGVIEQRTECYVAGGDPRYWRPEAVGSGGASETTATTAAAKPSNFARWIVKAPAAGRYSVEAYVQGGEATAAGYAIVHGGTIDKVTVDQTMSNGYVALGDFAFAGSGDEYIELDDNTGTKGNRLVFDAMRVTSLDGPGPGGDDTGGGGGGGCSAGGGGGLALGLLALAFVRRRR